MAIAMLAATYWSEGLRFGFVVPGFGVDSPILDGNSEQAKAERADHPTSW
jgi:hypothetical protein